MSAVPRIGRLLDAVGSVLFVGGAGLFAWAWAGFRRVTSYAPSPDDPPFSAIRMADGYWLLQKIGASVMFAGLAVFVTAWWVARRIRRSEDAKLA